MDRRLFWTSGVLNEVNLAYRKAEGDYSLERMLESMEIQALTEAETACGQGGFLAAKIGKILSPQQFNALSQKDKETAIVLLGKSGLVGYSRDDKIYVSLSPAISRSSACTFFVIFSMLEKLSKAVLAIKPVWEIKFNAPAENKRDYIQWETLLTKLYPWITSAQEAFSRPAVDLPLQSAEPVRNVSTNRAPSPQDNQSIQFLNQDELANSVSSIQRINGDTFKPVPDNFLDSNTNSVAKAAEENKSAKQQNNTGSNSIKSLFPESLTVRVMFYKSMPHIPFLDNDGTVYVLTEKSDTEKMASEIDNIFPKEATWGQFCDSFYKSYSHLGCSKIAVNTGNRKILIDYDLSLEYNGKKTEYQLNGNKLNLYLIQLLQLKNGQGINKGNSNYAELLKLLFEEELGKTLFFVPMVYDNDSKQQAAADRTLHFFSDTDRVVKNIFVKNDNKGGICINSNDDSLVFMDGSEGYVSANSSSGQAMHMITLQEADGTLFIPGFTNLAELREMYTENRVAIAMLSDMVKLKNGSIKGIILNPFSINYVVPDELLKQEKPVADTSDPLLKGRAPSQPIIDTAPKAVVTDNIPSPVIQKSDDDFTKGFVDLGPDDSDKDKDVNYDTILGIKSDNTADKGKDVDKNKADDFADILGVKPDDASPIDDSDDEDKKDKKSRKKDKKDKKPKSKAKRIIITIVSVLAALFIILVSISVISDISYRRGKKVEWSTIIDSELLPIPESDYVAYYYDSDSYISFDIARCSHEQFKLYVMECKSMGYTIDADILSDSNSDYYIAYNEEGYKLDLSYSDYCNQINVRLYNPITFYKVIWPDEEKCYGLPDPESDKIIIENNSSNLFSAMVGECDFEGFKDYVNKCYEAGFNRDYNGSEINNPLYDEYDNGTTYNLYNAEKNCVTIEYEGGNIISIKISKSN